jgi:hypothetical protein
VQGKTKLVNATELLALLRDFYRNKLAIRQRHVAAARHVTHYDFNNTYQYVIAREDVQLNWLRDAITDMGGALEEVAEPQITASGTAAEALAELIATDRDAAQAFVDTWRPRLEAMPNARHRSLLRVILGETLEHKRFFEQALAGRTDLLGRRADGAGTGGGVLPTRWVER